MMLSCSEIQTRDDGDKLRHSLMGSTLRLLALDDADDALMDDRNSFMSTQRIIRIVLEAFERGALHVVLATSLSPDEINPSVLSR